MTQLIDGKQISARLLEDVAGDVERLKAGVGITPARALKRRENDRFDQPGQRCGWPSFA